MDDLDLQAWLRLCADDPEKASISSEEFRLAADRLETLLTEIKDAYMSGFYDGQANIVEGFPLDAKFGFEHYQKDAASGDKNG